MYDGVVCSVVFQDTARPSSPSNGAIVDDPEMQLYIQRWGDSSNPSFGDIHRCVCVWFVLL